MEVLPVDYIISFNKGTNMCAVCLTPYSSFDYWILGSVFMRNLYSIHDYDNKRMGFVPFTGSVKKAATLATTVPTANLPDVALLINETRIFGLTVTEFVVLVVLLSVMIAAIVFIVLFCFQTNHLLRSAKKSI